MPDVNDGFSGFSIEPLTSFVIHPAVDKQLLPLGFSGISVEPLTSFIPTRNESLLGFAGFAVEKIIRRLNSLAFGNLLSFVTNPRLDELRVTLPDGRVFELGSNLAYGTISVPFCFFDEADEGSIQVTGTRRGTWNGVEYTEGFSIVV